MCIRDRNMSGTYTISPNIVFGPFYSHRPVSYTHLDVYKRQDLELTEPEDEKRMAKMGAFGEIYAQVYALDTYDGYVNAYRDVIGARQERYLNYRSLADQDVYKRQAMSQWQYTGYAAMLIIVGIQRVSPAVLESSKLDGCGFWQQARYIIIPQIKDTITIVIIITLNWAMQVFNEIQVMTAGGPGNATQTLGNYMYTAAWSYDKFGYASAIGNLRCV